MKDWKFDWHLQIEFYFDYMYYVRDIDIKEVNKDEHKYVWHWLGMDGKTIEDSQYYFELMGEKNENGNVLVNDNMFLNVVDMKTKEVVKRITYFDIHICC